MQKGLKINHIILYGGLLLVGLLAFVSLKTAPTEAATGINQTINFQGRLLNSQGATVPDGFYNIQFKIYQDGDGQSVGNTTGSPSGTLKWTESHLNTSSQGVKVVNGYLSVNLGSVTAFGTNIDWNQDTLWLSMNVGNTNTSCTPFSSCAPDGEMVPMQPMTSAPYALNSGQLGGLTSAQFVQIAQGLQTDASNASTISINKTGTGNILDLQKSGNSIFLISNTGQTSITTTASNALLVRDSSGTSFLSVDTSGGNVNIGVTGVTSANSTIHIADSSSGVQTVTVGSTSSSSTTTIKAGSGGITLNGDITVSSGKNFTQSGTGTFSTGSGTNTLNGDTSIASNKNFTQNGSGTFSTGSGTNTLNGDTTVAGTKNLTINGGNTSLGGNLDVTGSAALKKGTDYSTTGITNNANFGNVSLVRLTGASAQTITGIAGGRDGYMLTIVNAGSTTATITNNDTNSSAANRITTGGGNISLTVGSNVPLVYDSAAGLWRANSGNTTSLQNAYNNSTSPQITLSSSNGGLVVQDASSAIGADLFTVQSNGGTTKYFNVDATTVAINDNLTVSGTYNSNTFTSTALTFGGGSGTISTSSGNLTIQAPSTNSLLLDTAGAGNVTLGSNALTINIGSNNVAHNIHVGDGGTSATEVVTIGSSGAAASSVTINSGSSGGITLNGDVTVSSGKNFTQSGTGAFSTGSGSVALNGDTVIATGKNFTQNGGGTFSTGSGAVSVNGDTTIASGKNFTQSGTGTFSSGSGANNLNGDVTVASGKNFTQSGTGTFSTGSGTNTLNGDTTVAGTKNFTVNGGNTVLGGNLDVAGSAALKKGTDFSTTGTTNNASFSNASLIRLTGSSAQTITGIAGGRDGYILTLVNAGSTAATLTNGDTNSSLGNRILTGTGNSISLLVNATVTLVYDSGSGVWRAGSVTSINNLQTAYNNSTSPQITLSSSNGGLVVQDASSAIGADLFTVQSNGGATKYFNVDATTVAINDNLTVSGTYNTNTFTSTALTFGGGSSTITTSSGNLTIQAPSTNSLLLDTAGAGSVTFGSNALTINIGSNNVAHNIHVGDGGTSAVETISIGSSGAAASAVTINAGSSGGIALNGDVTVGSGKNFTQSGTGAFSSGSGSVALNGDTVIATGKNFTQNGGGTFSTGSGAVSVNGDTTIASGKNFTQSGTGTFSTGSGANSLNGDTTIATGKNFTQNGGGTFSSGSGTNTLNGDTTVAGTKTFTVNGGNTSLGANLDVTGATGQTLTGIAGGRDGYVLTLINAGSAAATLTNNDSNSSSGNRIITGTGGPISVAVNTTVTLVYDSATAVWRAGTVGGTNNLQTVYNNSTSSPQITLNSTNGGLVVQDASSAIGADLFTVQSNGGTTKYFNVTSSTVAINDNLTVSGTYNTNTFTSTALTFGGASGAVSSSSGNLTIQAASSNSLILDTGGAGTVSIATGNATTVNVATNNTAHAIHIGDGGTSTAQTITIGSSGAAASAVTIVAGSSGGITLNGDVTVSSGKNFTQSGTGAFSSGSGSVALNGDTTVASGKNFTQNGGGTFSTGTGAVSVNGDTTIASGKNFTQSGAGTFSTGSGANSLNGDTTIASGKNFTQSGGGTFSTGSGTNTLNGDTTVAGTKNFTVNGGNTVLGANLDVTGSEALKKGTDFSTNNTTNNAAFANASLIRLTGSNQIITGIAGGRDGYILTLVNAGSNTATLTNNDSNSSAGNRITTGSGTSIQLPVGSSLTLVYDSTAAVWRASAGNSTTLQNAYNNSTSPQITLNSTNGGLVVQDASSAIGADLFTVQSNGAATKYFNVTSSTVAINDNVTVSGTYNTNTFTSTALTFGGASGIVSSNSGNLTIQAASTNSLLLDTGGAGTVAIATGNAATVNVATNNITHAVHIGDGGTSAVQTITIGSSGAAASAVTINAGASGGITLNGSTTISGANSFNTGTGNVNLNGDTAVASGKNFIQNGGGTFGTGTGAVSLNGDTSVASGKNFTQAGAGTFSSGSGTNSLNGNTTVASGKSFTALGDALFKDASNSASAFQVQNNSNFNVMAVDTSANHLKVYDGTATQAYIDIYYDDATSSGVIAASTGTTKIGNGTGPISLNAGASAAVTIAGHATSTWTLDSGDLTIDVTSGSTPNLNLGTGAQAKTINIGNGTGGTAVNVQCGTGTCGFGNNATDHSTTVGSTSGTSLTTVRSGSGGISLTGNTTVTGANTFTTGTGAVALNGDTTIASGKNFIQNGGGTFGTGTGAVSLNGDTTIASGKNFTQAGGGTFSTGTGTNSLNGDTTVAANKSFSALGAALFKDATASTSAFQIQNASGTQLIGVDTTTNNLIVNPSIEQAIAGNWTTKGTGATVTQSPNQQYIGSNSLSVVTSTSANAGASQSITFTASTTYTLSMYVKSAHTTLSTINMGYQNVTGTDVDCLTAQTVVDTAWTKLSCTFTTGATITSSNVYIKDTSATAHTFYVDAVQLTRFSLLNNPSIEQAIAGNWTAYNGAGGTIAQSAAQHFDGANALSLVNGGVTNRGMQQSIALSTSSTYYLSFYSMSTVNFATLRAGYSSTGAVGGEVDCLTAQSVVTTGWTQYTCSFTTPASTSGSPYLYFVDASATSLTFYIDAVELTLGPPLANYSTGAPVAGSFITNPNASYSEGTIAINGIIDSPLVLQNQSDSSSAFKVQDTTGTTIFNVNTLSSSVEVTGSGSSSGLRFTNLNSTSTGGSGFTGILGLDTQGNVGLSQASVSLTSPALAYWDGVNDPTTGSQAYPTPTLSGNASYVGGGNGVRLTQNAASQNGSINWNFSQVSFEEAQFQFRAGGGTGAADSTWFYSYSAGASGASAVPTTEYGCNVTPNSSCSGTTGPFIASGYVIYFSEFHHCVGVAWSNYDDGNQCNNGGGTSNAGDSPLASTRIWNLGDDAFHDVDIQIRWNQIIVKWDGATVLTVSDSYGRDLSNLGFGFGSRTGGSNNNHYIKGLLVTKLGTDTSRYNVASVSPMGGNMYMDNTNGRLGIGTATPDSTLEVNGTESHKTIATSGAGVAAGNWILEGSGTGFGTATSCTTTGSSGTNYTANANIVGTGTSFTSQMVGDQIVLPDGTIDTIATFTDSTHITTTSTHLECPGPYTVLTPAFSVTGTATPKIQIGNATSDTTQALLQLDSFSTLADTATCTTTTNQGAIYYNTNSNAIRGCINGGWEDVVSTAALGLQLFGVVPDSGTTPGDWIGINGTNPSTGPCKVYMGSTTATVRWTGCTAYSGGRKVVITAQAANQSPTLTNGNTVHLCLTGTNNQPAFSASGTENANLPTFSAAAPIVCLADLKTSGTAITGIYDTRTFTTTTKEIVNNTTATPALGMIVLQSATAGQVNTAGTTAGTGSLRGIVVAATAGTQTANALNMIIATAGPAYAKSTAGTVAQDVETGSATAGYAITTGTVPAPVAGYGSLGIALSAFSNTCAANADSCRGSLALNLAIR
jgi:hypothetical protein